MSSPTRLDAIVTQNSILRQLFRQAAEHRDLDLRIKRLLDEPVQSHIRVAVVRDGNLVLVADSPAWAAKLRYQIPDLRRRMHENTAFPEIEAIRVKVAKSDTPRQPDVRPPQSPLSRGAAEGVKRQAESVKDPVLREALLRLTELRKR
ncbi:MAG: DUF721 domain-containing protein [Gammaproteobacteria bacterium]|jgi:hypothetical protein|nr:DUF721 domain-containing protein [Gammaproteobacteria bacterium]